MIHKTKHIVIWHFAGKMFLIYFGENDNKKYGLFLQEMDELLLP